MNSELAKLAMAIATGHARLIFQCGYKIKCIYYMAEILHADWLISHPDLARSEIYFAYS